MAQAQVAVHMLAARARVVALQTPAWVRQRIGIHADADRTANRRPRSSSRHERACVRLCARALACLRRVFGSVTSLMCVVCLPIADFLHV